MRGLIASLLLVAAPASALNEGLQCVPYARALSGVSIYGDAHTWWGQAEGRYNRGNEPKVGAVLAFIPHGNMRLGHVAAVRRVVDRRTILISHANWSTIDGVRGHVEDDVRVVDVSEDNDWSRVRVWYTPNEALGSTEWPVHGFIYPKQVRSWSEGRKAALNLLGYRSPVQAKPGSTVASATGSKPLAVDAAVRTRTAFSLSPALLAEIDKRAAKDRKKRT